MCFEYVEIFHHVHLFIFQNYSPAIMMKKTARMTANRGFRKINVTTNWNIAILKILDGCSFCF